VQQTGPFAREGDFVPKIGPAPEISSAAFSLSMDKPVGPKVYEQNGTFYVIELVNREKPDDKDFETHKDELREQVLSQKRQARVSAFVNELKAAAKIDENQELIAPSSRLHTNEEAS
jgi:peptidyl-prolyl cis-trans isomerase D